MGGTKTSKFHNLWIVGPLGTRICGCNYTITLLNIAEKDGSIGKHYFYESHNSGNRIFHRLWKRRAPKHDEDPLN